MPAWGFYAVAIGYAKLSSTIIVLLGSSGDLESQAKDCIPVLLFLGILQEIG